MKPDPSPVWLSFDQAGSANFTVTETVLHGRPVTDHFTVSGDTVHMRGVIVLPGKITLRDWLELAQTPIPRAWRRLKGLTK